MNEVAWSWRRDQSAQVRCSFKGFEIVTVGSVRKDAVPSLYVRGKETYEAKLNLENPLGIIASIEHVLRNLDKHAENKRLEVLRNERHLPTTGRSWAAHSTMTNGSRSCSPSRRS